MRTLLLLRGCPGSGKSTWIKENKLEPYTISSDNLRTMVQSPVMNIDGKLEITQKNDKKVWDLLFKIMEERMKKGEFIVIDATHNNDKMIKQYRNYADTYKYCVFVKEFNTPIEVCIDRNNKRDEYKRVPIDVIERSYRNISMSKIPNFVTGVINDLSEIDNFYIEDLSHYDKLVFIGDIHGCYEPLKKVVNIFDIRTAYIFLGDYIDRGLQNKEVMEFMLSIYKNPNVFLLEGNHENILLPFSRGIETGKKHFDLITKPQLDGIDLKEIKLFYKRLRQCMKIKYHDKKFLVTHGGLPINPKQITLISTQQLIKGVGDYETDIDKIYHINKELNDGFIQIHGHRSLEDSPTSISLEDEIEYGGNLKVLEVTKHNMEINLFKNDLWDKKLLDFNTQTLNGETKKGLETENDDINKMSKSFLVKTKHLKNNVCSLNFTEGAFKKKVWNYQTIKARGLFVDKDSGKVVARSYDKFFNLFEVPDTSIHKLKRNLQFPVKFYEKENGYLGIISHLNGELAFYSKSTNDGDHVNWLKEIFYSKIKGKEKELLDIIIKHDISLVFEVVDIHNDPHIIKYGNNELFLLNTFKNDLDTQKDIGYDEIVDLLINTDIKNKSLMGIYNTFDDMMLEINYLSEKVKNEGIVIEDNNGFMFKVKFYYYNEWKSCRYLKYQIDKNLGYFEVRMANTNLQAKFGKWYSDNFSLELMNKSIIELRDMFEKSIKL